MCPPRPDNYAQRGGRAGRRTRVGMVLGYTRNTPHDQYFYDRPEEMIAGEVPAPVISLGNRDVLKRHLYAIVFGAADPGLGGKMADYILTEGQIKTDAVSALIEGIKAKTEYAIELALQSWGKNTLERAGLSAADLRTYLSELPVRIQHVIDCTSRQVIELRQALDFFAQSLNRQQAGIRAANLVARLLGVPTDRSQHSQEADDRSAGYPLRRFAEFGLLPGYEFPALPASLRLVGEEHEEDTVTVVRRFGIAQFQPNAHVYARRKRWKVSGLDTSSPWNPRADGPSWSYRVCGRCDLRFDADQPKCPRCGEVHNGPFHPSYEFAGFRAFRNEIPILDEEERWAVRNLVSVEPQWNGNVTGRWSFANGWALRLSSNEEVRWLNEGRTPTPEDFQNGNFLHQNAKGYLLCPSCGNILEPPQSQQQPARGRRNAARQANARTNSGHSATCPMAGNRPSHLAICTSGQQEILRLLIPVPSSEREERILAWGVSLGYALLYGMQHHFMLDANELDFEIEGPWEAEVDKTRFPLLSLAFVDVSLGGSGYLTRIAQNFNSVAKRALVHLDHNDCDSACYRCLKAYRNQRYHRLLSWPQTVPALDELAAAPPTIRALKTGDIDDPRPWLDAYAAGVGSPLELQFLNLFTKYGFNPQKQVPVAPTPGEAPISLADFAVPEKQLAIYIDGAAFHVGQNLRRDRYIRGRLRNGNPPWRVEELRVADLREEEKLVQRLMSI
jgi:hypothetical protein